MADFIAEQQITVTLRSMIPFGVDKGLRSRADLVAEVSDHVRRLSRSKEVGQVRMELKRILESEQFRPSHRSSVFLEHVVEGALQGNFDALKERVLGVELFGRDALFNTEHDSVVRVAANDVRKRLSEYYRDRPQVGVRISLLPGLYIPKIEIVSEPVATRAREPASPAGFGSIPGRYRRLAIALPLAVVLIFASYLGLSLHSGPDRQSVRNLLPWSVLLRSGKPLNLVLADANLVFAQAKLGHEVSIDNYAGHRFDYSAGAEDPFNGFLNGIPLTSVSDAILANRIAALVKAAGGHRTVSILQPFSDFGAQKRRATGFFR
ncbi:MAG: hypothetical protein ACRD22_03610 [Terriglobia bacterium]